ncbi:Putative NAD(P)H nitroreductase YdjA [Roseivivax sp. THAF40]|uniref:nitroreductase family protein n=1 Tax=unclassified Roseivivax TaxID=2639302 RepID=UPI00126920DC|nr:MULTISPECIES: nitroreductase [unclassified Roseivivax]QFS81303.1 Putative NAD(P)H nitroreductase YdjA [Roseivivax sp. THAF197b]QFT45032.1 Putative NAD(P)H nitroreductase YdjA [Roseivivax sp. THAF40]
MPDANPAALDFLLTRRSRPAKTLSGPAPGRDALVPLLTAASRSPDHGKLEPWRFIVLERAALDRLAEAAVARGQDMGLDPEQIEKGRKQFADSPLCVAVIETPKASPKVPALEQTYAVGGVCLALLNAALAAGWGANWLTGWVAHDRTLTASALDLSEEERVAGFIHIGTETSTPPERPRPDLDRIVTWQSA